MQFTTRNGYHWRQYILEMCDYTSEVVKKRNYYLHTNITVGIKIIIKKKKWRSFGPFQNYLEYILTINKIRGRKISFIYIFCKTIYISYKQQIFNLHIILTHTKSLVNIIYYFTEKR